MRTKLSLFTKEFAATGAKKVNTVSIQSKAPRHDEFDFKEEAKYLYNKVVGF